MKPIKVEFQAFGPYAGKESIDFSDLSKKGLFLICGKTGSGKTMILDAIMIALFGKSSGETRDKLEDLRCNRCDEKLSTYVAFEFENHGKKYRFERGLEKKRINLSPYIVAGEINEEGNIEPFFQNPKAKPVTKKAEEILGLDADQFSQVIILPQGKFERFLVSKVEEKEEILEKIFKCDNWEKIAENFFKMAKAEEEKLKEEKTKVDSKLEEEGCGSIEELDEKVKELHEQCEKKNDEYKASKFDEQLEQLKKKREQANRFNEIKDVKKQIVDLESKDEKIAEDEQRVAIAVKAESFREYIEKEQSVANELKKREKALDKAKADSLNKSELLKKLDQEYKDFSKESEKIEALKEEKTNLELRVDVYQEIDSEYEKVKLAKKELKNAKDACEKAAKQLEKAEALTSKLAEETIQLRQEHDELMRAYVSGMSAELAKDLSEGEPCPVCGSTHHPSKASVTTDHVSREQVDAADERESKKNEEFKKADDKKKELEESQKNLAEVVVEKEKAYEIAKTKYEASKEQMIEGIDSLEELKAAIEAKQKTIIDYENKDIEYKDQIEKSKISVAEASQAEKTANDENNKAHQESEKLQSEIELKIKESDFDSFDKAKNSLLDVNEQNKISEACAAHKANKKNATDRLSELEKLVEGVEEISLLAVEEEEKKISAQKDEYIKLITSLKGDYERLKNTSETIAKKDSYLRENEARVGKMTKFAKSLRGDTGIGLKRYVLATMFSKVVIAANKMLENVHGGRYRLKRTDSKTSSSNKRGLNLNVIDSFAEDGMPRSVSTLSGGEKFLVSLALSIGMSTIAKTSGVNIEAMFIDEGFGSLDSDSIADALEILEGVKEASGMVGIISHVEVLRSNISVKLNVEKNRESSYIVPSLG